MFIVKTERKFDSFNLDNNEQRKAYEELIASPDVTIIGKKFNTQEETNYDGENSSTISALYVYVEYEVCSL